MVNEKKAFKLIGMTTFLVSISFIVDTVSGVILYVAPPERIAHWTDWTCWGFDKEEWIAIHAIFGYLLLVIVGLHLYYNWRTFTLFLWDEVHGALNLKWELGVATLISLAVFLGTLWNLPPFSTTMNLGEDTKNSWEESKITPPVPHADGISLKGFSTIIKVPVEQILVVLKSNAYEVNSRSRPLGRLRRKMGFHRARSLRP
jgi:hypothetical protein